MRTRSEERTLLEVALTHERIVTTTLLILIPLASWTWIAMMARDMYGTMLGSSAWMMTSTWDAPHLLLLWAMWAVMMTAMMLPSAAPLILLYAGGLRSQRGIGRRPATLCDGRRIPARVGNLQRRRDGVAAIAVVGARADADDGAGHSCRRSRGPRHRRGLPAHSSEAGVPPRLPIPALVSDAALAQRQRPAPFVSAWTTGSTASAAAGP